MEKKIKNIYQLLMTPNLQDIERTRVFYEYNAVLFYRKKFDKEFPKLKTKLITKKIQAIGKWMKKQMNEFKEKYKKKKPKKDLSEQHKKNLEFSYAWENHGKNLPKEPWRPQSWSFFKFNFIADTYYAKHPLRRKKVTEEEFQQYFEQGYHEDEHEVWKFETNSQGKLFWTLDQLNEYQLMSSE